MFLFSVEFFLINFFIWKPLPQKYISNICCVEASNLPSWGVNFALRYPPLFCFIRGVIHCEADISLDYTVNFF